MNASRAERHPGAERTMRADARRNYERLVSAASQTFAERGTDEASLEEIARRAGVGIGTLYRHFPTRQELLEAVYRGEVDALRARADHLIATLPPAQALAALLADLVEFGRTKRRLTTAMIATLSKDSEFISACSAIMRGALVDVLRRAQESGAVRADADPTDILRLTHAISIATEPEPGDPGRADRMLALILDGLRPPQGAHTKDGG